jgi:hypothetical protein
MTSDRPAGPIVIAGCSRRKLPSPVPVPALDLYQGGCIPALRARCAAEPGLRARTWIISGQHGLLHADTPVLPYDRQMDPRRAAELRPQVSAALRTGCLRDGIPSQALVIAEPAYQVALADLPALLGTGTVTWISDPSTQWPRARAILDSWRPAP